MYHCELTRPPTSANSYRKSQSRLKVLGAWLNPEILKSQQKLDSITRPFTSRMLQCAIPLNARLLRTLGIPWISQFVFSKVPKCLPRPQSSSLCAWPASLEAKQSTTIKSSWSRSNRTAHKSCHYFQVSKILAISIFINSAFLLCEIQVRRTILSHFVKNPLFFVQKVDFDKACICKIRLTLIFRK